MTNTNITTDRIATILTDLGFEIADSPEFVADVARLAGAWDRKGLIFRIKNGAMEYGEAAEIADAILEAIAPPDLSQSQELYMGALEAIKDALRDKGDERRLHVVEGIEALFRGSFDGVEATVAVGVFLEALGSTKAETEDLGDEDARRDIDGAEALFRSIFGIAAA